MSEDRYKQVAQKAAAELEILAAATNAKGWAEVNPSVLHRIANELLAPACGEGLADHAQP